jgi:hypothetical protein
MKAGLKKGLIPDYRPGTTNSSRTLAACTCTPFGHASIDAAECDSARLRIPRGQCESVQRDDLFPPQLVGVASTHHRHVALLDELAHLAAESGHARAWTTADARRATASDALGLAVV